MEDRPTEASAQPSVAQNIISQVVKLKVRNSMLKRKRRILLEELYVRSCPKVCDRMPPDCLTI